MMLKTVRQLLDDRGCQLWFVPPEASVLEALRLMDEHDIDSLLVVQGDRLVGTFSAVDYTRRVALQTRITAETPVGELMNCDIFTVDPGQSLEDSIEIMARHNLSLMPVVEGLRVIGAVSLADAVRATLRDQRSTIRFLEALAADADVLV